MLEMRRKFRCYDRSSDTKSRRDMTYTDIKIAYNIKINHIIISFTDHYNIIYFDRHPSKDKI